jgi:hypothetical protein
LLGTLQSWESLGTKKCFKLLECETITLLWDGIFEDIMPYLLIETKMSNGKPISYHKSKSASLGWRTCHDKLHNKGVFKHFGSVDNYVDVF